MLKFSTELETLDSLIFAISTELVYAVLTRDNRSAPVGY